MVVCEVGQCIYCEDFKDKNTPLGASIAVLEADQSVHVEKVSGCPSDAQVAVVESEQFVYIEMEKETDFLHDVHVVESVAERSALDAIDATKRYLVETIDTPKNSTASEMKEEVAFQAASDATERRFGDKEFAETNQKQVVTMVTLISHGAEATTQW